MSAPIWPVTGIDHILIAVRDLKQARTAYEGLGFRPTPMGRHTKLGSVNHCLMLENDYLELLAIDPESSVPNRWAGLLEVRQGVGAVALRSTDSKGAAVALRAAGLNPGDVSEFSRPVERPDGVKDASFTVLHIDHAATPGLREFLCQHHTPELVWLPEYQGHPNGAKAITEVIVVAPDPSAVVAAQERMFNTRAMGNSPHARVIETGTATMMVMTPDAFLKRFPKASLVKAALPYVAGFSLRLRDTMASAGWFRKQGISFERSADGRAYLPPERACGVTLQFEMPA